VWNGPQHCAFASDALRRSDARALSTKVPKWRRTPWRSGSSASKRFACRAAWRPGHLLELSLLLLRLRGLAVSEAWLAHAAARAERMVERCGLGPDTPVVEVASNDGCSANFLALAERA